MVRPICFWSYYHYSQSNHTKPNLFPTITLMNHNNVFCYNHKNTKILLFQKNNQFVHPFTFQGVPLSCALYPPACTRQIIFPICCELDRRLNSFSTQERKSLSDLCQQLLEAVGLFVSMSIIDCVMIFAMWSQNKRDVEGEE